MKQKNGGIEIALLLLIFAGSFILAGGLFTFKKTPSSFKTTNITGNVNPSSQKTLQLITLPSTAPADSSPTSTPAPTPPPVPFSTNNQCNHDDGLPSDPASCTCSGTFFVECNNGKCIRFLDFRGLGVTDCAVTGENGFDEGNFGDMICTRLALNGTGTFCVAKPVIYLYPTKKTLVDVSVETSGKIVVSDPLYPINGWKNVLAYPNGDLFYNGKKYLELFYESDVADVKKPDTGIYISKSNLDTELPRIITLLGLKDSEKQEFLDYWLPRLTLLDSKYIFFSVLDDKEKERVDKVNISPKPDTFIAFIAYFKGVDVLSPIEPLILPQNPPKRIGFTAVEWGGTIEPTGAR